MFRPNLTGHVERRRGFDAYGQAIVSAPVPIRFAMVNLRQRGGKTTVRTDSSASRGTSDEITTDLGRILVGKIYSIEIGDIFSFDGFSYDVSSKHVRRAITGQVDHFECELELRPR